MTASTLFENEDKEKPIKKKILLHHIATREH